MEQFNEDSGTRSYYTVSVTTAAAVLAYSRIYMSKIILDIINRGGVVYYTDTDSIVTNIPLDDSLIHNTTLGKFKLEYVIKDAYFVADKTYYLKTADDKVIIKAKGVNSNSLTLRRFKPYARNRM